ncbi:UDP-glucose 4-epimerase GalE [Evansella sp. LMS18]|uniref:UDP-glucose 4-epimerase GalE n=1 Tax=Evansella sp. LMS18 TaxID=2924033 RepID=UPI0020D1E51B|nr:UDP-glucose 4-epimerase GalE [Evansella sp. LMS18]UTR13078.1 UDP-glucose 4-epimerase GalE [Evansella sp. LMS18]
MQILVTGGAGYIGSHTCIQLLNSGYEAIIVDNFSNSKPEALKRVEQITGEKLKFYKTDILDQEALIKVFEENKIEAVIHFAGLKAVGESVTLPLKYYQNNIAGTLVLLEVMEAFEVDKLVFSSSATVYGEQQCVPLNEALRVQATNPYGRTKLMIEQILQDVYQSNNNWSIALLRYFNPIGAHESGLIGEDPSGIPNNLVPYITQVAVGKLSKLNVFGNDYPTYDGTGIRDYIHVMDLADGHLKALEKVLSTRGAEAYNLGTGRGFSVLEMVQAFEAEIGKRIPFEVKARRPGDIAVSYADPSKAEIELNWRAERGLAEMCRDSWNWQKHNPKGYKKITENQVTS